MALKPDRIELLTDVSFFMANATSSTIERGGVASVDTTGSGVAMDDANAVVKYHATASEAKPVGILLNDVVNIDLTRQHINWHKDEVQGGGKVTLLSQGQVTTDMIVTGNAPAAGSGAYVGADGKLTTDSSAGEQVGTFLSQKDSDGYAKVSVNIV